MAARPKAPGENPETRRRELLPAGEASGGGPARRGAQPPGRRLPPGGPGHGGGQPAPGGPEGPSVPPDVERALASERRRVGSAGRRRTGEVRPEAEAPPAEQEEVRGRGFGVSGSGFRVQVSLLVLRQDLHESGRDGGAPAATPDGVETAKL